MLEKDECSYLRSIARLIFLSKITTLILIPMNFFTSLTLGILISGLGIAVAPASEKSEARTDRPNIIL